GRGGILLVAQEPFEPRGIARLEHEDDALERKVGGGGTEGLRAGEARGDPADETSLAAIRGERPHRERGDGQGDEKSDEQRREAQRRAEGGRGDHQYLQPGVSPKSPPPESELSLEPYP